MSGDRVVNPALIADAQAIVNNCGANIVDTANHARANMNAMGGAFQGMVIDTTVQFDNEIQTCLNKVNETMSTLNNAAVNATVDQQTGISTQFSSQIGAR